MSVLSASIAEEDTKETSLSPEHKEEEEEEEDIPETMAKLHPLLKEDLADVET